MSLIATVVDLLKERAEAGATSNELHDALKHQGVTLAQIRKALENARQGRHVRVERGKGIGKGSMPGRWFWQQQAERPNAFRRRREPPKVKPVPSVWDMGGLEIPWPPKFQGGRAYSPLGSWKE